MRPDVATTRAFRYCLAVASQDTNVGVIAYIANSNHWHGVVVDRDGRLPEFLHSFHLLFAKHQNCLRGRWENFWASEQTSVVELIEPDDIVEKCAYVFANPVKDQLIERAHQWPGASGLAALRHPRRISANRPRRFFRARGSHLPASTALELCLPPGVGDRAEFRRRVDERIAAIEARAENHRRLSRTCVFGTRRILRQPWQQRPQSAARHRRLSPVIACRNRSMRVEALQRRRRWLTAYADCRDRHAAGEHGVIFPVGTYRLVRQSAVVVATAPD